MEISEDQFFQLLRDIAKNKIPVEELKKFMKTIEDECEEEELDVSEFLEEVFLDLICEEVYQILNDSDWRSDEVGPECVTDPELLRELYPILTGIDTNVEIVFASNPNTPIDILNELSNSTFSWEEDSTAGALARNAVDQSLLKKLGADSDSSVRYCVAENPNTPTSLLEELSQDMGFSEHMLYMTFDGGMSPSATDFASEVIRCSIKYAVVHNINTPIEIITQMANSNKNFVLKSNAASPFGADDEEQVNLRFKAEAEKVLQSRSHSR
jgi:hypothetical protein